MSFWFIILGLTFIVAGLGFLYLVSRIGKFRFMEKLSRGKKSLRRLISFGILAAVFGLFALIFDVFNSIIIILNLMMIWLIFEGIAHLIGLIRSKFVSGQAVPKETPDEPAFGGPDFGGPYYTGIIAVAFTLIYLSIGYILAHNVWVTNYTIDSPKIDGNPLRIVMFADAHIGTTFDGEGFAREMEKVQAQNPDAVLICGDLADDGTSLEDMERAAKALGELKTTYGVYYVFGNHDMGLGRRAYGGDLITSCLTDNDIIVMVDDTIKINDSYVIIGREDRSKENYRGLKRASMDKLVKDIDSNLFSIVMDHQPGDFDAQAKSGVDLVLCGHTHAGQMIPITYVGEWFGLNDSTYGIETRKNTTFIITSGISNWEFMFKTGCKSEIVVVDIQ